MRRIDSGASFHPSFVHAARELLAEYREKLRVHQMTLKPVEHLLLEPVPPDVEPVFAGAFVPRSRAAQERLRDHRIAAAAGRRIWSVPRTGTWRVAARAAGSACRYCVRP